MRQHMLGRSGALIVAAALGSLMSVTLAGQSAPRTAWTPARTPWGHPDLRGIWDFQSIVPLERPAEYAGRDLLADEEAAAVERQALERLNADRRDGGAQADIARAYNEIWYSRRPVSNNRTSLVIDPADGRVPPLTAEGQRIVARNQSRNRRGDQGAVAWTTELDTYTR